MCIEAIHVCYLKLLNSGLVVTQSYVLKSITEGEKSSSLATYSETFIHLQKVPQLCIVCSTLSTLRVSLGAWHSPDLVGPSQGGSVG